MPFPELKARPLKTHLSISERANGLWSHFTKGEKGHVKITFISCLPLPALVRVHSQVTSVSFNSPH